MSFNNLDSLYRQVIMDHYKNPRNHGTLPDNSLTLEMNNPTCGDRIEIHLMIEDDRITDVKFEGEGCSISLASASMMTEAIKGQKLIDALKMSESFSKLMLGEIDELSDPDMGDAEALQGVSKFPARIKCATLAWKAMEKATKQSE
ncbi:MAG: SUF system NifU family Fe-S cluster assembly protein [Amphibacillus sp.]|uniref:Putative FeS assembly protein SufE n=1 Tax=Amphibacillus xylanus (strain ATCC 51415 / DSM 6626 / JCM 7361 / LMG 17667 / NBRC 15112 / Ep01) TaxID=698758 RepID=K0IWT7_AMPXN|nr:SUF system NifU family Fe-S cluster assembly protein [Amphibacillus xylanus]NMA90834.1 SUF system NifU family Fe-S cluster assembly protein [Amphibacillus sp.]BAM46945.1 putative FeS assembly protein SufE [Amphibacillus xylanus NBRC 15112]